MSTRAQKNNKSLYVCCPVCGIQLFRSKVSEVEIRCSRCHSELAIEIKGGRMVIAESVAAVQMVAEAPAVYGAQ